MADTPKTIGEIGRTMRTPETLPGAATISQAAKAPPVAQTAQTIGDAGREMNKPAVSAAGYRTIGEIGKGMTQPAVGAPGSPTIGDVGRTMYQPAVAASAPTIAEQGRTLFKDFTDGNFQKMGTTLSQTGASMWDRLSGVLADKPPSAPSGPAADVSRGSGATVKLDTMKP